MDFCSSFRASGERSFAEIKQPQTMFKALRRLHGQNLESKGLNDITEAFQTFVTRARFFSVGKLRKAEDAERAKNATADQLKLYDQVMLVTAYVSKHKGGKGILLADDYKDDSSSISRASSTQSLVSTTMSVSSHEGISLNDFPSRVLQRIVAYLPIMDTLRVERINKRWMEASIKSWSLISCLTLARECDGVRGFGKNKPMRNNHIKLDLTGLRTSWDSLNEFGEGLPCLRKLAYRDMENVGDKAFWFLIKGSGHLLKFVDFRGCKRLRGRCFRLFSNQLEQLYLDGCSHIDEMAFEDLCTSATALKELRINECFKITDENLSMISRVLSDLQVLTLCGDRFENLTATGLSHISRIRTLGELALDYNPLINDDFLIAIANEIPNLKSLSLANAGSDQSLTARGILALTKLDKLEQLDLSSLAAIRSSVLLEIVSCCKNLELLQLRNCVYLNDDGVIALTTFEHIRHVDLSGSILVTNEAIQAFIKAFPQVQKFLPITIVVGGTAVNASRLSVRGSRVVLDFSDYSTLMNLSSNQNTSYRIVSKFTRIPPICNAVLLKQSSLQVSYSPLDEVLDLKAEMKIVWYT
uniref:F-box domain-containing protein n=1 Tax=Heterorhabditis bacteriophora TaxID=37862 RepID=A0A1I7X9Q2_HETBA